MARPAGPDWNRLDLPCSTWVSSGRTEACRGCSAALPSLRHQRFVTDPAGIDRVGRRKERGGHEGRRGGVDKVTCSSCLVWGPLGGCNWPSYGCCFLSHCRLLFASHSLFCLFPLAFSPPIVLHVGDARALVLGWSRSKSERTSPVFSRTCTYMLLFHRVSRRAEPCLVFSSFLRGPLHEVRATTARWSTTAVALVRNRLGAALWRILS